MAKLLIPRFFGVRTLQEIQASICRIHENTGKGLQTIAILSILPARVVAPLSFLQHILILDSDVEPANDISFLREVFDIGVLQVCSTEVFTPFHPYNNLPTHS